MQPNQNPKQQAAGSSWLASEQFTPTPQPRKKWRLLVVFAIITLALAGIATTLSLAAPACLTAKDYEALTGEPYDSQMQAASSFYTGIVSFKDQSTDYTIPEQITQLADFYRSRSHLSIHFTITGNYTYDQQAELALSRLETIQKSLTSAGVPAALITVELPLLTESPEAAEAIDSEATTISITSAAGCRQG